MPQKRNKSHSVLPPFLLLTLWMYAWHGSTIYTRIRYYTLTFARVCVAVYIQIYIYTYIYMHIDASSFALGMPRRAVDRQESRNTSIRPRGLKSMDRFRKGRLDTSGFVVSANPLSLARDIIDRYLERWLLRRRGKSVAIFNLDCESLLFLSFLERSSSLPFRRNAKEKLIPLTSVTLLISGWSAKISLIARARISYPSCFLARGQRTRSAR